MFLDLPPQNIIVKIGVSFIDPFHFPDEIVQPLERTRARSVTARAVARLFVCLQAFQTGPLGVVVLISGNCEQRSYHRFLEIGKRKAFGDLGHGWTDLVGEFKIVVLGELSLLLILSVW